MKKYIEDTRSVVLYELNKNNIMKRFDWLAFVNNFRLKTMIYKALVLVKKVVRKLLNKNKYNDKEFEYVLPVEKEIYYNSIPKVVVYTCIVGRYDELLEPLFINDNIKYCAITDFEINKKSKWDRIDINDLDIPVKSDGVAINRWIKLHPHKIFNEYDFSIYVDGSIRIVADLMPWVLGLPPECFLGIHKHPIRNRIITEMNAIVDYKKTNVKKLKQQISDYYKDGYDDSFGILEATVLIRKHNNVVCQNVMEDWWRELNRYQFRDQVSLPYVLWKNSIKDGQIKCFECCVSTNPRIIWNNHLV